MDSAEGKLFIGGIAPEMTEERLKEHFSHYGDVSHAVIARDKVTGQPRGFGFVSFCDPSVLESVLNDEHTIDGRTVEAKRAISRGKQYSLRSRHIKEGRNFTATGNFRTKKIFVGGLPSTLSEDEFGQYFQDYGNVIDLVIMIDQSTGRPRGFGFIIFDTEDAVDRVLQKSFHELNGKLVEVKRAVPKDVTPHAGSHGGYNGYGSNSRTFSSGMENTRFLYPQAVIGGYHPYSRFGIPLYVYGMGNTISGYGSYGNYGFGGYGSVHAGYAAALGGNGMGGPSNSLKTQWQNETPGCDASGCGLDSGCSNTAPPMTGQSSDGAAQYGNQGYGEGSYDQTDTSFTD